ncbi:MAG: hypothetical protein UHI81_09575 [Olegusella sp.]|nr:hypothetical protein [Olegusella sp.]
MNYDCWTYYLTIYYALDAAYAAHPSESLNEYLSEANPDLWEGKGSADPAVWHGFERAFRDSFRADAANLEDALPFVRHYVAEQGGRYSELYEDQCDFLGMFDNKVPAEKWEEACERVAAFLQR